MPTALTRESIFSCVSDETLGFQFGKPDRPSDTSLACILPILRETAQKRQYVTLPEAGDKVVISDSGSINKVMLKNTSEENVFVRSGSIFGGKGTQSRALMRSAVLFAGQEVGLEVRCVHASHHISKGSAFQYDGVTPLEVDNQFYQDGYRPSDQSTMWNLVKSTNTTMSYMIGDSGPEMKIPRHRERSLGNQPRRSFISDPTVRRWGPSLRAAGMRTEAKGHGRGNFNFDRGAFFTSHLADETNAFTGDDDLRNNFDAFAKNFDSILSKARLHDHQVGLALITERGAQTIELFDLDTSWEAMHKDAVKRMGTELLRGPDETNVFEYKPDRAVAAVRAVLALPFTQNVIYEHKPSNGEPYVAVTGLTAKDWVGELAEIDLRVIHMTLLRKAS
jgi:hypothetical protein